MGWDGFGAEQAAAAEGRHLDRPGVLRRGHGRRPLRGRHVHVETNGRVMVATGLTSQGQGHETVFAQIVADELAWTWATSSSPPGTPGGSLRRRHLRQPGGGDERQRRGARRPAGAGQGDPHRRRGAGGGPRRPRHRVRGGARGARPAVAFRSPGRRAVQPAALSFSKEAQAATQFASPPDPDVPPVPDDEEPGLEARDYYSPVRSTFASGCMPPWWRSTPTPAKSTCCAMRWCTIADR